MTPPVHRVLVALDASAPSRAALEAAVALLRRDDGEVLALFVEDENLLRLAALPRALAFSGRGGAPCALDPVAMGRELRELADQARRLAEEVTRRTRVHVQFRATRGRVTAEILAAARDADLVVLGRRARPAGRAPLGSTARSVAAAGGAVLLLDADDTLTGPVVVAVDGTAAGDAALAVARGLARRLDGGHADGLQVLVLPDAAGRLEAATAHAEQGLASATTRPAVHRLRGRAPTIVGTATRLVGGRTLVLPASLVGEDDLDAWVAAAPGPLVVVGPAPADVHRP